MLTCIAMLLVCAGAASAQIIYAPASGDGQIGRSWWMNGSDNWVDTQSSVISMDYYYQYWAYGVVQMPITQLHGATLAPESAKLWFYSFGLSNAELRAFNFDSAGTIAWSYVNSGQSAVTTINASEGWVSVDVTPQLQSQINAGYNWAGFMLRGTSIGGSIAAAEDPLGRGAYLQVVPEPSSMLALFAGATGLAGIALRRRK